MTEWRTVERPSTLSAGPRAQVVGDIPDVHVITVRERRVTVDYPTIIQNNMNTDTVDLVLDGEWDGMSVVCYIGHPGDLGEFEWEGTPFTLPVYDTTGSIDVTVVGLSADGKTRLVTVEAKGVMDVIKSGEFEGSVPPEDQPDLLGQILAAGDAANKSAQAANTAATAANTAASSANAAAAAANGAAEDATAAAQNALNIANSIASIEPPSDDEVQELREENATLATALVELQDGYIVLGETAYMPTNRRTALSSETVTVAQANVSGETATLN